MYYVMFNTSSLNRVVKYYKSWDMALWGAAWHQSAKGWVVVEMGET